MLRACALDFGNQWDDNVAYAEFTYNNCYRTSIGMAPFEALYGRKCQSPLYWRKPDQDQNISEPLDMVGIQQKVQLVQERLLTAQSRQKSYADNRRRTLESSAGERVFFRLTPRRSIRKDKKRKKLQPHNIGPFSIIQRIQKVAYQLELPPEFKGMHNVFQVSQLRQYIPNPEHVINDKPIKLKTDLNYDEQSIKILEFGEKELRNKKISLVKVLWNNHPVPDATWETEIEMRRMYPHLFEMY
jgi:hypothetical protein